MPKEHLQFIFFHGKGGSGKDTQAEFLLKEYEGKAIKISTGEIYRGAKSDTGEYARYHQRIVPFITKVDAGILLPNEVIVRIVKDVIKEKIQEGKEIFIFTGFPRTEAQLVMVDKMLGKFSQKFEVRSNHIYYSLSDDICRQRAQHRRDSTQMLGEATRVDDNPQVIEDRLVVFTKQTKPMIDRLSSEGRLITIEASGNISEIEKETSIRLSKERV